MKKSDCTPEEWEAYKAYQREHYQKNAEKERARRRARNALPEVQEARRLYDSRPERREARRAYDKANRKQQWALVKANPEAMAKRYAAIRAWRTGMTSEQFDALMALQEGKCAICGLTFSGAKGDRQTKQKTYPCADHCHDGGGPRGILCPACNHIEGRIRSTGLSVLGFCDRLHDYLLNPPINLIKTG